MRLRGSCSGSGRRAGLRRVKARTGVSGSCASGSLGLGSGLFQRFERQLQLFDAGGAFGGRSVLLPPQAGDLQLQPLDLMSKVRRAAPLRPWLPLPVARCARPGSSRAPRQGRLATALACWSRPQ